MDIAEKSRRLKRMFERIAPELLETRRSGLESIGAEEEGIDTATGGLERLASNVTLEGPQAGALEAIIHKKHRPAVFVVNDSFTTPPAPWAEFGDNAKRTNIEVAVKSIGRIELPGFAAAPFGGTGFVVGENLLMTNRHVAEIFARGLGQQQLFFRPGRASAINFRKEVVPTPDVPNLRVTNIVMIHPYWDMALLKVEGLTAQQQPLKISATQPEDLADRDIAVIGYPAQDIRNEIALQNEIFGGVFDVKRLLPGKMRERRQIDSFENNISAVTHDASTLGGNSGSAVVDVETGEIVALHFAGLYLDANFAVPSYELARDSRVVDAGVNFVGAVPSTDEWLGRWQIADQHVEGARIPTSLSPQSVTQSQVQGTTVQTTGNSASITIPLHVTVSIGGTPPAVAASTTPQQQPPTSEGLFGFGGPEKDSIIARAYSLFRASSFDQDGFSWNAALAAGAASHLAYSDAARVKTVCQQQWKFETCDCILVNDTECFVASTPSAVLVSFRGTAGVSDWLRDLAVFSTKVDYGSVHRGFYFGFKQASTQLTNVLQQVNAKNKNLVLTGHSLGGALATIAAAEWEDEYKVSAVYTFGQPAVGKTDFRSFMGGLGLGFNRIVNDDDIVTRVPPGYVHIGKLSRLGARGGVPHESIATAAEVDTPMMSETQFRGLQESCARASQLESTTGLEGILPSFSDHKLYRYLDKIMAQI